MKNKKAGWMIRAILFFVIVYIIYQAGKFIINWMF